MFKNLSYYLIFMIITTTANTCHPPHTHAHPHAHTHVHIRTHTYKQTNTHIFHVSTNLGRPLTNNHLIYLCRRSNYVQMPNTFL